MDCKSIGQANPDIAGIGLLVAFVVQSLIAVIVSSYAWLLSSIVQERWNAADPNPQRNHLFDYDVPERLRPLFRILQNIDPLSLLYKYSASWRNKIPTNMAWLTGKQPSYPRRRDPESRIEDEITPTTRRLDCANKVLLAGNDSQTFAGIALLISALIQSSTLTFYHMHIIYDTISLVIISNCAASFCIFRDGLFKGYARLTLIAIWAVLFIAYVSVFATRLQKWDYEVPSHCYQAATALSNARHPYVDNIYIAITFLFIVLSFSYALNLSFDSTLRQLNNKLSKLTSDLFGTNSNASFIASRTIQIMLQSYALGTASFNVPATDLQYSILSIAMLQCPLHIYSIFALRAANEQLLEGGTTEKEWGFGQIAAVVLLGGNILQIVDGVFEYKEYRKTEVLNTALRNDDEGLAVN